MADTPERKVKKRVTKILDSCQIYYTYTVTGGYGKSGVPDLLACIKGRFVGIEVKAGKNKPTALQLLHMAQIEASGGRTWVVNEDNIEEFETWVLEQQ